MKKSLTKKEIIKRRAELREVFSSGRRLSTRGMKLVYRRNGLAASRIVVAPVRKFGTAVERNYAKRVGRELFRTMKPSIETGYDMAIILFPGTYSYGERADQFRSLLRRAGLIRKEEPVGGSP